MNNSSHYFSFRRVLVGLLILTHAFSCPSNKKLPVSSKQDTSSVKKGCIDKALIDQLDEGDEGEKLLKETLQKLNETKCEGINEKLESEQVSVLGLALYIFGADQFNKKKWHVMENITLSLIDNGAKIKEAMPQQNLAVCFACLCERFTQEALKKSIEAFHEENISLSSPDFLDALYFLDNNQAINQEDSVERVKMLIAGGLNIDAVDEEKNTILHRISLVEKIEEKDRLSFLKWLFVLHSKLDKFDLSASLDKKNKTNQTPQEVAEKGGFRHLAKMLATKPAGIALLLKNNFPVNSWHRSALQKHMKECKKDEKAYKALDVLLEEISDPTMLNEKTTVCGRNEASALGLAVFLAKHQASCIKDIIIDLLKNGASTDSIITLGETDTTPLLMEAMMNDDEDLRARLIDASHQQAGSGILDKKLIIDLGEQIKAEQDADDRNDWMALKLGLEKIKTKADLNNDAYRIKFIPGDEEITVSVLGGALGMCTEDSIEKSVIFEKIAYALLEQGASTAGVASQEGARFPLLMLMDNCSLDLQKKMIEKSTKNTVNGSAQFKDEDEIPLAIISSILENEELAPLDRKALIELAVQKGLEINTVAESTGNTLLHFYIKKNDKEAIKTLLALHQAKVFNLHGSFVQENNALETPLALASNANYKSIYRLLKKTVLEDAVRKGPHRSLIDELDNCVKGLPNTSNTEAIELFRIAVLEIATGDRSPNGYTVNEGKSSEIDLPVIAIISTNGTGVLNFFKKTNKFFYMNEVFSDQNLFSHTSPAVLKWCCTNYPLAQGLNISSSKLLLEKNKNFTDTEKEAFSEWLDNQKKAQPVKAIQELYNTISDFNKKYAVSGGASEIVKIFSGKLFSQSGKDIFSINTSSNLLRRPSTLLVSLVTSWKKTYSKKLSWACSRRE